MTLMGVLMMTNAQGNGDILIAVFEGETFGKWSASGEAFGDGPVRGEAALAAGISGYEGSGYASSNVHGYQGEGILRSPEFRIERPYINFLLAGGLTDETYMRLLVNGRQVQTVQPTSPARLTWQSWDVSASVGQMARIELIDDKSGHPHGYLCVDSIYQSERPRAPLHLTRGKYPNILDGLAFNPDPQRLPTLGASMLGEYLMVTLKFPERPGITFDAWCYEVPGFTYLGIGVEATGGLRMEHRVEKDGLTFRLATHVIPTEGAVDFVVRPVADADKGESLPPKLPVPNLCFQMQRAPDFGSRLPREEHYPEFIARCFIFTEKGQTFLNRTERIRRPDRTEEPLDHIPWAQRYRPVGYPEAESSDRFVLPLIGTVSRDGRHLVALADDSSNLLSQVYKHCLHSLPRWQPEDAAPAGQTWRLRIYLMENDPDALIARVKADFPNLARQR